MLRAHVRDCRDVGCEGCKPCGEKAHCVARPRCVGHPGRGDISCVKCVKRGRGDIRQITDLSALTMSAALEHGRVTSELVTLAGPSVNPYTLQARRVHLRRIVDGICSTREASRYYGHAAEALQSIVEHDGHPEAVLTRWAMMTRDTLGIRAGCMCPPDAPVCVCGVVGTVTAAAAFLLRNLHAIANDEVHGFPDMLAELRECRTMLEDRLAVGDHPQQGAPCPTCSDTYTAALEVWQDDAATWEAASAEERVGEAPPRPRRAPRLVKAYEVEDVSGVSDMWECSRCGYTCTDAIYQAYVGGAAREHAEKLTAAEIADTYRVKPGTLRKWAHDGKVIKRGKDASGRMLYDVATVLETREAATSPG